MSKLLCLVGVAAIALAAVGRVEGADDGAKGKRDAGAMFKRLDANSDGKITPDEFKKLAEAGKGRLKDKPELLDRMFKRLDANNDGSLSADELKKFGERAKNKKPAKS